MMDALLVSNVLLWLLVIGLALTVLALTRQIGLLHERISPVGALSPEATVSVGERAPEPPVAPQAPPVQVEVPSTHSPTPRVAGSPV